MRMHHYFCVYIHFLCIRAMSSCLYFSTMWFRFYGQSTCLTVNTLAFASYKILQIHYLFTGFSWVRKGAYGLLRLWEYSLCRKTVLVLLDSRWSCPSIIARRRVDVIVCHFRFVSHEQELKQSPAQHSPPQRQRSIHSAKRRRSTGLLQAVPPPRIPPESIAILDR